MKCEKCKELREKLALSRKGNLKLLKVIKRLDEEIKKTKKIEVKINTQKLSPGVYGYICPTCGTSFEFHGGSIFMSHVTNFRCECGQELKVMPNNDTP